ncbi:hypothetical protein MTR_2g007040 [Medicago truncatula]|uniref:Uncharacterized protein n=1 Tax=Medicago truncatula TaxID=3880 RepID=G7IPH4_MEDTR|nr:hypothetical protein MTR_2g007040 [Medicago truncatula]
MEEGKRFKSMIWGQKLIINHHSFTIRNMTICQIPNKNAKNRVILGACVICEGQTPVFPKAFPAIPKLDFRWVSLALPLGNLSGVQGPVKDSRQTCIFLVMFGE